MTDEMMALRSMVEKGADTDALRPTISFAAERLMDLEVHALTGAAPGERSSDRLVQRNGHRDPPGQTSRRRRRQGASYTAQRDMIALRPAAGWSRLQYSVTLFRYREPRW